MTNQKKNKKNKKGGSTIKGPLGGGPPPGSPQAKLREIQKGVLQAEKLWKNGDALGALDIVEDLLEKNSKNARLVFMAGVLYTEVGLSQEGLERLELADQLEPDNPSILSSLALAYLASNNPAHSLMAFRRLRLVDENEELYGPEEKERVKILEKIFKEEADTNKVPRVLMEQAMVVMERGEMAFEREETAIGLELLARATTLLPNWAPPRNNLSLYQWQVGQAEKAIQTAREVIEKINSQDYQTLSNLTRFLALAGKKEEARGYLEKLLDIFEKQAPRRGSSGEFPTEESLNLALPLFYKTAEGLASLEQDQKLYTILKEGLDLGMDFDYNLIYLLGVAAWNLGKAEEARKYWKEFEGDLDNLPLQGLLLAIERPRPSNSPSLRLPYFETGYLLPPEVIKDLLIIDEEAGVFNKQAIEASYRRLSPYYPILTAQFQNLAFGVPLVIEATLQILSSMDFPEARQALKEFALGPEGSEEGRKRAISVLISLKELSNEDEITFWQDNPPEWKQISLRNFPSFENLN